MTRISHWFEPIRKVAQAFFVDDVKLRRGEKGLTVTLEEPPPVAQARAKSPAELAADKQRRELQLILSQLADVLNEQPETRASMRHLVFVEYSLTRRGLKALRKMPLDVLKKALEQFESLVTNWSPEGLANLRSKMAVAIIDRENGPVTTTEPEGLDSVFAPERIEAVLEPSRAAPARAAQEARDSAFADSTIEKLALEFGVASSAPRGTPRAVIELQGELRPRSPKASIDVRKLPT
jgi:hypothetical protein